MFSKELELVDDKPAVSNPSLKFNTLCIMFYCETSKISYNYYESI